ncbi:Ig-like domain-containing protein [Membranihabitans maritimus]|uniref:Ig-like domain-containing protein n=1 Tax=Membranihabitans maritimus TaxID=2904244 RepID=UPI001F3EDB34|nr:Ig-like domain-containing protein [Membranihabitans maritimus]
MHVNCKYVFFILIFTGFSTAVSGQLKVPFSTDSNSLTIYDGSEYVPFFIKGVNLGVAVPGTFPGELAATRKDYARWIHQIKEAGFNCIRLYTLHYPRFYEVLDSFNRENPQSPLHFFQGIWLEEELEGYENDLYFLTSAFRHEIEDNVNCVYGNNNITQRQGKAYGLYTADVSQWCLGYIIGREIFPEEVLVTNEDNLQLSSYSGNHFAIENASPSEVWVTEMLDFLVDFENKNYNTQRPVSVSSWPTLDPIEHPEEENQYEDLASIDLSKVEILNAPAGMFISYHAYPYYPDFISLQSSYQEFHDDYGPNSYLGYLSELKMHYAGLPLVIAEYGVPSSWANAHFSTSGMNQGGFDEYHQGLTNIRLLESIYKASCAGGIQFAWIDEWFKRTWITDPVDYIPSSRILWHNKASAEQNYGLVSFDPVSTFDTLVNYESGSDIEYLNVSANFAFLELELGLNEPMDLPGEIWIALDTYDETVGESILPNGEEVTNRSEFALKVTNYDATLFITQAYDLFGIWHNVSEEDQLYRSVATDGKPWNIVRLRNNYFYSDVQYVGDLQTNVDFQPGSSKDAVTISDKKISIRIPWSYINVVAPDQMRVFHDNRNTPETESIISDGIAFSVIYRGEEFLSENRYRWSSWHTVDPQNIKQRLKTSYRVVKDQLVQYNTLPIAVRDSFFHTDQNSSFMVGVGESILNNDFDLDGNVPMISILAKQAEMGKVNLRNDGSFSYSPEPGFLGVDSFQYYVYDGRTLSKPSTVILRGDMMSSANASIAKELVDMNIFPNPVGQNLYLKSEKDIVSVKIFSGEGKFINSFRPHGRDVRIDLSGYPPGNYVLLAEIDKQMVSKLFFKQ